ncbi:MAG: PAS domain-containing sensor histidine kinase [Promethearchaeota archaeon]|nr:MAG: PAS domain-containing sensor histidine kinase [Candidatus Lokiarchaeota archaeon]
MNGSENDHEAKKNSFEMKQLFYDTLFRRFSDAIIILDKNGNIIDISESALEFLGAEIKKQDIIGRSGFQFIAPDYLEMARNDYNEALKSGFLRDKEYKFMASNSSFLYGKLSATLIPDQEGNPQYFIAIIRDITQEKLNKTELVKRREMFQLVLDNIPQFIFWKDINSVYLGCNQNFARVAGVGDPSKIIGKTDFDLPWEKSQAESFYEIDRLVMESDKSEYHIIEPQLQADGKKAWLDTNKIPLHDSEGEVVGLLGTYEDITERVLAKKALEQSEKKYRESYSRANFYKDIFSHDIGNILQNIGSANDLINIFLEKPEKTEELKEIITIIKDQVLRGAKLIDNIQKLSQIEESENPLKQMDLCNVLKDSINFIDNWIQKTNLDIQVNTYKPNVSIHANELLIDVFENLLINAVKYNENPIVEITINITEYQNKDNNYIRIDFLDNGIGIEDARKEEIFQRAYNKEKSTTGLGLGLSLVKKIVESYYGQIWIEDRIKGDPSKGCDFVILLPIV